MTTYYIDYNSGSDSNTGTSDSTAWKHCPGDSNATDNPASTNLSAGDIVIFKKGVLYLGRITTIANSGTLLKSGTNASITSSGVLTSTGANFQTAGVQAGDYIFIYHEKDSVTNTWVESSGLWSLASVDSETQITLTSFDGVAHSTTEMYYRVIRPITFKSISSWGTGDATIDGENSRNDGFNFSVSMIRFEDLVFHDMNNCGIYYTGSDLHVLHCTFDLIDAGVGAALAGNYNSGSYPTPGRWSYIHGNTVTNCGCGLIKHNTYNGIIDGNNIDGSGANCSKGIFLVDRYCIVRYNIVNNVVGTFEGHADSIGFIDRGAFDDRRWQWIYGNDIFEGVELIALYESSGVGPKDMVLHSNVIRGEIDTTGYGDAGINAQGLSNVYIFNNTIYSSDGRPFNKGVWFYYATTDGVNFKNNVFAGPDMNSQGAILYFDYNGTGHSIDYNHYYCLDRTTPFRYDSAYKTYAQWQAYGWDANSSVNITTDPKFVSTTYASPDVHLQSDSPLIGAGTDLSSYFTLDKDKNTRVNWDIGAYEYYDISSDPWPLVEPYPPERIYMKGHN